VLVDHITRPWASTRIRPRGRWIYQGLLRTGAKTKLLRKLNEQIEALALVSILALRTAYCRLLEENAEGTPPARIDPPASANSPHTGGGVPTAASG
jgi:hypothetical protein